MSNSEITRTVGYDPFVVRKIAQNAADHTDLYTYHTFAFHFVSTRLNTSPDSNVLPNESKLTFKTLSF